MKLVHLADLHLGYRAYNRLSPEGLNVREKDVIKAFKESLDKISELNPDIIVMAGDIFHKPRPSNSSIYLAIKLLQAFRQKCSTPIIMISGNHEAVKSVESGNVLSIFETVIPNVRVINDNIQEVIVDNLNISVLCVPHGGLSDIEKAVLKPNKDYKYNIMVIHGTYENCPELAGYGNGALIKDSVINQSDWDYVAFGHYHKFTELAPNAYYSGAIERTTTNIWQEADDKKGFIVYDFDKRECRHVSLSSPRKVIDIKKINAKELTAVDINQKIDEEISKITDLDKSIVRITIENVDPVAMREIDYKKIREIKKTAVHFRLNLIKRDFSVSQDENDQSIQCKKGLFEYLDEEISEFELSQGIDKDKFSKLAKEYLAVVTEV
ncbi:MAG: exonuclease SbcCD subunit D [Candidatus Gastranaerophilales bacterium]|nr:exonuclease SbcCD subunit D [Candidatus Gastranaerophilales bacterium]